MASIHVNGMMRWLKSSLPNSIIVGVLLEGCGMHSTDSQDVKLHAYDQTRY